MTPAGASGATVFALPTAWRPAPGSDPAPETAVVEHADLADGLGALAGICGTDLPTVLLAAHIKVLGMLGEADERCAEVADGAGVRHVTVVRAAATWQELVLRVAKAERPPAGSADEVTHGERALFTAGAEAGGERDGSDGWSGGVGSGARLARGGSVGRPGSDGRVEGSGSGGSGARLARGGSAGRPGSDGSVERPGSDGRVEGSGSGGSGARLARGGSGERSGSGGSVEGSGNGGNVERLARGGGGERPARGGGGRPGSDGSVEGSASGGSVERRMRDGSGGPPGSGGDDQRSGYGLRVHADERRLTFTAALAPPYLARLASMHREVLRAMAADPGGDALAARLDPDERRAVLGDWSTGPRLDRGAGTVVERIEAQAATTPDATAVKVAGTATTYRELDERANRIARRLAGLGARPDALVGVCLRRTADLLPALLGVWKSGAGYLPLDPALPAERLRHMIDAAGCELVLTESAHLPALEPQAGCDVVLLDRERESIEALPATPLDRTTDPRSLAYVIYTSGSTGNPKGVMVEHAGLANYLLWTAETYAARGTGGSPVFSSISFDLGMPSLFAPLLTGQPVHLLPDPLDTADLGDELAAGAPYSFIKMTPGHLDLLSYDLTPDEIHSLAGLVIAAGDAFTSELARRWLEFAGPGGTPVATEYGPTEITVGNSGETLTEPPATELIPLGAPIPNTTMYVLTDRLEPVPVGVPGEVYIGGTGVARGYLDRPGLTAERFLPDPYGAPGSCLYRTGDRARWRADGSLEFLGRVDHQVKIRGFRVELGEIQARLREHADVAEAVVIAVGPVRSRSLAAYVIPAGGTPMDATGLRDHLAAVLPAYMLPAHFVAIDQVPLTTNGKVDTRVLQSLL
ncbi:amino acid adenylation domain-containing protein [Streptomyces chartreusis]|uniref:Amino acid adenylation domain-containing protein n=1 Tax=Streptomyces chartreusis TaxID=1969 RepID=A0A7H8T7X6_STRCX|nr:amino acid adenylation domain-containing protein [Streptomyces chartreusis]QKZ19591.1 amino acid adenylation domain-containing protein [Streptomyces chartreusis]